MSLSIESVCTHLCTHDLQHQLQLYPATVKLSLAQIIVKVGLNMHVDACECMSNSFKFPVLWWCQSSQDVFPQVETHLVLDWYQRKGWRFQPDNLFVQFDGENDGEARGATGAGHHSTKSTTSLSVPTCQMPVKNQFETAFCCFFPRACASFSASSNRGSCFIP